MHPPGNLTPSGCLIIACLIRDGSGKGQQLSRDEHQAHRTDAAETILCIGVDSNKAEVRACCVGESRNFSELSIEG